MLEACQRSGVRLAIGHEWRWMDLHVKARSLIAEGAIGEPWFAYVSVDPGGLMNRGTHQINYTLYVLGDPKVKWVLANVQRETDRYERGWPAEDLAGAMVGLDNGVRIAIDSEVRPSVNDDESAQIVGGKRRAHPLAVRLHAGPLRPQGPAETRTGISGFSRQVRIELPNSLRTRLPTSPDGRAEKSRLTEVTPTSRFKLKRSLWGFTNRPVPTRWCDCR